MNEQVAGVVVTFLTILMFCIIGRSLLTWLPIQRDHPVVRVLDQITEPLLQPVRNILPKNSMIDFSGMVVILILFVLIRLAEGVANP